MVTRDLSLRRCLLSTDLCSSNRAAVRGQEQGAKVAEAEGEDRVIWSKQDADCYSFLLSGWRAFGGSE